MWAKFKISHKIIFVRRNSRVIFQKQNRTLRLFLLYLPYHILLKHGCLKVLSRNLHLLSENNMNKEVSSMISCAIPNPKFLYPFLYSFFLHNTKLNLRRLCCLIMTPFFCLFPVSLIPYACQLLQLWK